MSVEQQLKNQKERAKALTEDVEKALAEFYPKIPHNERADALRKVLPYLEACR